MYSRDDLAYFKDLERLAIKAQSLRPPIVETKPKIKYESNEKVIKTLLRLDN